MTATTAGELAGMAVRLVNVRFGDRAVRSEAMVTSLAGPARGHVQDGDEGSIRRERCFPSPGSSDGGLGPLGVAPAVAAALAGHRTAEQDDAEDGEPGAENARHQAI
jgi:hypothetical protein